MPWFIYFQLSAEAVDTDSLVVHTQLGEDGGESGEVGEEGEVDEEVLDQEALQQDVLQQEVLQLGQDEQVLQQEDMTEALAEGDWLSESKCVNAGWKNWLGVLEWLRMLWILRVWLICNTCITAIVEQYCEHK